MNVPRLDTEYLTAYFDETTHITYIIYQGKLTPEITVRAYRWLYETLDIIDVKDVRGAIFDFRKVTDFHNTNLSTAQRTSQQANARYDFSRIPAALIVDNMLQWEMVKVSMRVTPQERRKRIVKSEAEALAFIERWHATQKSAGED